MTATDRVKDARLPLVDRLAAAVEAAQGLQAAVAALVGAMPDGDDALHGAAGLVRAREAADEGLQEIGYAVRGLEVAAALFAWHSREGTAR